ncbi:hypothetical protein QBC34DRAFT_304663 [Podospora aff. communis PSN243]|uniref:Mid2 domain-containing protein n=1 Tax=Podospora aff. communis PSN243 TaxID=3040156 RepID=A0AAV9GCW6_9PEZI|nr:hypothetical protein QBC34DRAFT_304663 [Podospora aff. communis PSN243]
MRLPNALVASCWAATCSAQTLSTFKFPEGATPAGFQGFVTHGPGTGHLELTHRSSGTLPNCYTMTIYQSYPFAADYWLKIGCVQPDFDAHTIYREIVPTAATTSAGAGPSTGSSATTTPFASKTGGADAQRSAEASLTQSNSEPSKAWIAGAVIGPVLAIALAAFVVFWVKRRRGRSEAEEAGKVEYASPNKHELQSISPLRLEESPKGVVELAPVELPDHRRWELDSYPVVEAGGRENRRA